VVANPPLQLNALLVIFTEQADPWTLRRYDLAYFWTYTGPKKDNVTDGVPA